MAVKHLETTFDHQTQTGEQLFYNSDTGMMYENKVADLTTLMDHNAILRNNTNGFSHDKDRSFRHIAEIDMVTVQKLLLEHNIDVFNKDDMPRLKQWLRDRDNRGFVVCSGKF